jgi:hypothetical protein
MHSPRQFFDAFVKRSYEEWLQAPVDLLRASCAVHQANVMAERMWHFYEKTDPARVRHATSKTGYRKALVRQCADFKFIWDADNDFKHVKLARMPRRAAVPGPEGLDGILRPIAVDGTLGPEVEPGPIVIVFEDGKRVPLSSALKNVIQMWERELAS